MSTKAALQYPPRSVVDALVTLGLTNYDLGWSIFDHDGRSETTTWSCTLATNEHLVIVEARASRKDGRAWTASERTPVEFKSAPKIEVKVSRLDAVVALTLNIEVADDDPFPRQETWQVTFADGKSDTYVLEHHTPKRDAIAALCRRLAANV